MGVVCSTEVAGRRNSMSASADSEKNCVTPPSMTLDEKYPWEVRDFIPPPTEDENGSHQNSLSSFGGSGSSFTALLPDDASPRITVSPMVRINPQLGSPMSDQSLGSLEDFDSSVSFNETLSDALKLPTMVGRKSSTSLSAENAQAVASLLECSSVVHPSPANLPVDGAESLHPVSAVALPSRSAVQHDSVTSPLIRNLALSRSRRAQLSTTHSSVSEGYGSSSSNSNSVLWGRQSGETGAYPPELAELISGSKDQTSASARSSGTSGESTVVSSSASYSLVGAPLRTEGKQSVMNSHSPPAVTFMRTPERASALLFSLEYC